MLMIMFVHSQFERVDEVDAGDGEEVVDVANDDGNGCHS